MSDVRPTEAKRGHRPAKACPPSKNGPMPPQKGASTGKFPWGPPGKKAWPPRTAAKRKKGLAPGASPQNLPRRSSRLEGMARQRPLNHCTN